MWGQTRPSFAVSPATRTDGLGDAQSAPIDCGCSVGTGSQVWLYIGRFSPQLA